MDKIKVKNIIGIVRETIHPEDFVSKMEKIMAINCSEIIVAKNGKDVELLEELAKLKDNRKTTEKIVVTSLSEFGLGIIKFWDTLQPLVDKGIEIESLEEHVILVKDNDFVKSLEVLYHMQRKVLSDSSKQGQLRAEENGFHPGRPTLSNDVITKIKSLRKEQKYSLREIAEMCNVSVGTVFKYTKN